MKLTKLLTSLCCFALVEVVTAQTKQDSKRAETTVEDEYLSNVEDIIIAELVSTDGYDNKLVALGYLEDAVSEGRASPEMVANLNRLAGEGVINQSKTNGRVTNNFPDVRAKACDILGQLPTKQSKSVLLSVAKEDKEPMVIAAAIRSLGIIGINENDEVVNNIMAIQRRYAIRNPSSSLAFEILVAYEKLANSTNDKVALIQAISEIATNYDYIPAVRQKATQMLKDMQESESNDNSNKKTGRKK